MWAIINFKICFCIYFFFINFSLFTFPFKVLYIYSSLNLFMSTFYPFYFSVMDFFCYWLINITVNRCSAVRIELISAL